MTAEPIWPGYGIGGTPALDFSNTLDWRLRQPPVECLKTFSDLLRWGLASEALTRADVRRLTAWAGSHPRLADLALAEAIEIREAIARVFYAQTRGQALPEKDLARVDGACRAAWVARVLAPAGSGAEWRWRDETSAAHRPAWNAALDAARILTSDDRDRVRECGDEKCGWFFLDTSRNRSRRWCNMQGCGNRNKARAFYKRSATGKSRPK